MTPEELKAAAEVMRRAAEGEAVECKARSFDDSWGRSNPIWNWADYEYRIAPPKPREWWGVATDRSVAFDYATRAEAEESLAYHRVKYGPGYTLVHITEVLP